MTAWSVSHWDCHDATDCRSTRGDIHYHDLDYSPLTSMTNCCLIDFKDMLANGFKIGNADVEPPRSIQTATAQMSQIVRMLHQVSTVVVHQIERMRY